MLRPFLYRLAQRLPCRLIDHEGHPYMERHLLGTIFGLRIYLHRFVASDPAGVHDHPFEHALSFIVAGWYFEDRWGFRRICRFFNRLGPNDFHRVVLPNNGKDVWTIFMHSKRVRPWGFMRQVMQQDNGAVLAYIPESQTDDPALSDWSKDAPGGVVRVQAKRHIPFGTNAYAAGLVQYPQADEQFHRPSLGRPEPRS